MTVILCTPGSLGPDAALAAALRAGAGEVMIADGVAAASTAREAARGAPLVVDVRAADADPGAVDELRLRLPGVRMLALARPGHAMPSEADATLVEPFYLEDVVRWCARAAQAPPGEDVLADLATGMRHEIGNPLTALMLQLELLRAEDGSGGLRDQLALLEDSGRRIQKVLDDVATASELRPVTRRPAPVTALLDAARERLAAVDDGLAGRLDLPTGEQVVEIDLELLARALADVWRYLLLAGDAGDRLALELPSREGRLALRMRAHVPRLPPDAARRLFTPLWARQALGLDPGLSLTAARSAFRRHGGDLRARQEPGGRMRVEALLPHASADRRTRRAAS